MIDNGHFLPEFAVVVYAAASLLMWVLVRRVRWTQFAWGAPGMSRNVGDGRIREVDVDEGPAMVAGTMGRNLVHNTTPGGFAALLTSGVWVVTALAAMMLVPAWFGAMTRPTTMNIVLLLVAGIALASAVTRMALTLLAWALAMVIPVIVIGLVLGVAYFAYGIFAAQSAQSGMPQLRVDPQRWVQSWSQASRVTDKRVDFNACIFKHAIFMPLYLIQPAGIHAACDPAWEKARQRDSAKVLHDAESKLRAEISEYEAWMQRYNRGIPFIPVIKNTQRLEGDWSGNVTCTGKHYYVSLRLQDSENGGQGVMFVVPGEDSARGGRERGRTSSGSAYAVNIIKNGADLDLHAGEPLFKGKNTPPLKGQARFDSQGFSPRIFLEGAGSGCTGSLQGRLTRH